MNNIVYKSLVCVTLYIASFHIEASTDKRYHLSNKSSSIGRWMRTYSSSKDLHPLEVLKKLDTAESTSYFNEVPNFGYTSDFVWSYFETINDTETTDWTFHLWHPLMQNLDLFRIEDNRIIDHRWGGRKRPVYEREITDINHAFKFNIGRNSATKWLVVLKSSGQMSIPLEILPSKDFKRDRGRFYFLFSMYFGGIIFLSGYNLFLFLRIRESSHLLYACYGVSLFFLHLSLYGFSSQFIFLKFYGNSRGIVVTCVGLMYGFLTLFAYKFIGINHQNRFTKCLSYTFALSNFCLAIYSIGYYNTISIKCAAISGTISPIAVLIIVLNGFILGSRASGYILLGFGLFFVAASTYSLKELGFLPVNWWTTFFPIVSSAIEMLLLSFAIGERIEQLKKINRSLEIRNTAHTAIARTTQMLAHDIRKPFTMIQGVIDSINGENSPSKIISKITKYGPQVNQSLISVNGMISDVMQIGQEVKLLKEPSSVKDLILISLKENLQFNKNFEQKIKTEIKTESLLDIDSTKVIRVFSNIVGNALQAMPSDGTLLITSEPDSDGWARIKIHNTGSYVKREVREQLFDMFFTSEKKGGTGLGLAIAKSVIEAHGGQIGCDSEEGTGTEFWFTLPLSDKQDESKTAIPGSAKELREKFSLEPEREKSCRHTSENKEEELRVESSILKGNKKITILIADDEPLYRSLVANHIEGSSISKLVDIVSKGTAEDAIKKLSEEEIDLALFDIDFGSGLLDGISAVKEIRSSGIQLPIWLCSNRDVALLAPKAMEAGANGFFPKPMTRIHLLKIIASAMGIPSVSNDPPTEQTAPLRGKKIALIDDNKMNHEMFAEFAKEADLHSFFSPEEFFKIAKSDLDYIDSYDAVLIDNCFGDRSKLDAFTTAKMMRGWAPQTCQLAVYSSTDFAQERLEGLFDLALPKNYQDAIKMLDAHLSMDVAHSKEPEKNPQEEEEIDWRVKRLRHDIFGRINILRGLATLLGNPEDHDYKDFSMKITAQVNEIEGIASKL